MGFWYYGRKEGEEGVKQREKGRASALVHQTWVKEKDIHDNLVIKEYWKKNGKSNSSSPCLSQ